MVTSCFAGFRQRYDEKIRGFKSDDRLSKLVEQYSDLVSKNGLVRTVQSDITSNGYVVTVGLKPQSCDYDERVLQSRFKQCTKKRGITDSFTYSAQSRSLEHRAKDFYVRTEFLPSQR